MVFAIKFGELFSSFHLCKISAFPGFCNSADSQIFLPSGHPDEALPPCSAGVLGSLYTRCLSHFLCCWHKISNSSNLKKKRFILAHILVHSLLAPRQEAQLRGLAEESSLRHGRREAEKGETGEGEKWSIQAMPPVAHLFPPGLTS